MAKLLLINPVVREEDEPRHEEDRHREDGEPRRPRRLPHGREEERPEDPGELVEDGEETEELRRSLARDHRGEERARQGLDRPEDEAA